jgi:hypothetical protein
MCPQILQADPATSAAISALDGSSTSRSASTDEGQELPRSAFEGPLRVGSWINLTAIGVVGGVLSGLFAVGGGILMVPLLVWRTGMDQRRAAATSLVAIVPTALVSSTTYLLNVAFTAGWLWRNGLLRHLHRDLHALEHDQPRECVEPMPNPRGRRILHRPSPAHRQVPPETR